MKVLLATDLNPSSINGVITSVMNLKKELQNKGHDVRILTLNLSHKDDVIEGDIYAIGSLSAERVYPNARASVKLYSKLLRELIDWCPDVIHTNCELTTFVMSMRIARKCDCPVVHTYHTVYEDYTHYFSPSESMGKKMVKEFTRFISGHVDALIAPTEKVNEILEGYKVKAPVSVIPTGISLDHFANKPSEEWLAAKREEYGLNGRKVLICLGRVAKEKNIETLINMVENLPKDYLFLIVGDGPDRERLEGIVASKEINDKVVFAGMVTPDQVPSYYCLGDIFVSASTSETQGLTYIEAMASGLPLLCKKDDCLNGVIYNGQNGYQWNSEIEFSSDLSTIMSDYKCFADMALEMSVNFSTKKFGASVIELYEQVITAYEPGSHKRFVISRNINYFSDKMKQAFSELANEGKISSFNIIPRFPAYKNIFSMDEVKEFFSTGELKEELKEEWENWKKYFFD